MAAKKSVKKNQDVAPPNKPVVVNGVSYPTIHRNMKGDIVKTKPGYYVSQFGDTRPIPKPKKTESAKTPKPKKKPPM